MICEGWGWGETQEDSKYFDGLDGKTELPLNEMEKTGGRSGLGERIRSSVWGNKFSMTTGYPDGEVSSLLGI